MDATHLERRTVSRKTPADGMVEITKPVARKLLKQGTEFELTTPAGEGKALLTTMPCTCRGADKPHEHWLLQSDLFRRLTPGSDIELSLEGTLIRVAMV